MEDPTSESPEKLWFPRRLRELRIGAGKKQREVAQVLSLRESSYANAESANHKRMSRSRVDRLAKFYQLSEHDHAALVAGWEALPESEWNKRNAKSWAERDAGRSLPKQVARLTEACIELATLLITSVERPSALCNCGFDDEASCELCNALRLLGLRGWTTRDEVIGKLAAAQEKLENTGKAT